MATLWPLPVHLMHFWGGFFVSKIRKQTVSLVFIKVSSLVLWGFPGIKTITHTHRPQEKQLIFINCYYTHIHGLIFFLRGHRQWQQSQFLEVIWPAPMLARAHLF